jgi:hypothetical protein
MVSFPGGKPGTGFDELASIVDHSPGWEFEYTPKASPWSNLYALIFFHQDKGASPANVAWPAHPIFRQVVFAVLQEFHFYLTLVYFVPNWHHP